MLVGSACLACGPAPARAPAPHRTPAPPELFKGQLWEYVPAGGLNWLLLGSPRALADDQVLLNTLEPVLPKARLDLYAKTTGLDLRDLENALVAGFDLGTLYMAETDIDLTPATHLFSERLISGAEVKRPHPALERVSGVVGKTPESLLRFDGKLLAVAVGDTTTVRIVEAFARGQLKRTTRALNGAALSSFRSFGRGAPVTFLAPGPFEGNWIYGVGGLLAAASGVGISATPVEGRFLDVVVAIDGPWQEETDTEPPITRLRQAWEGLAQSSTGRLFGLHQPVRDPTLARDEGRVELRVRLLLDPIVHGLRAAVAADVWEMLDLKAPAQNAPSSAEPGVDPATAPDSVVPRSMAPHHEKEPITRKTANHAQDGANHARERRYHALDGANHTEERR